MEVLPFAEKNVPVVCSEGNQFVQTFTGTSLDCTIDCQYLQIFLPHLLTAAH